MSRMPMRRVVEVTGNNLRLKQLARGRQAQQFIFSEKTKTITSVQFKNKSISIQNRGRATNLEMRNTNEKWY